jgi:lysophospholipase L1-like esterase
MNHKQAILATASVITALMLSACASGGSAGIGQGSAPFTGFPPDLTGAGRVSTARLQNALAKLRRGEALSVVTLGGSITTGYQADPPDTNGWAGLVKNWWETKAAETGAHINYHNSGASGTDSAFAAIRIQDHVLAYNPDVVIVEFGMNDQWLDAAVRKRSYEGLLRQLLDNSDRALALLAVNEKGSPTKSARKDQEPIGNYYGLPTIAWAGGVKNAADWGAYFTGGETIHPNDAGHASIAAQITALLDSLWANLPPDAEIPPVDAALPSPVVSDDFQTVTLIGSNDTAAVLDEGLWIPQRAHLPGEWESRGGTVPQGWVTDDPNAHLKIKVRGKSVGILFAESDRFRNTLAWLELPGGKTTAKVPVNTYVSYRNGYFGYAYAEVADNLDPKKDCILHITLSKTGAGAAGDLISSITGVLCTGLDR